MSWTPSFFRHFARISEPVSSAICAVSCQFHCRCERSEAMSMTACTVIEMALVAALLAMQLANHAAALQAADRVAIETKPAAQHVLVILSEQWRGLHRR